MSKDWQFFTSHGLVLISLLNRPGQTIREIGLELALTDRAVTRAIEDLIENGYIVKTKLGRRCFYRVNEEQPLRYPSGTIKQAIPLITTKALKAENLATHAEHLNDPHNAPIRRQPTEKLIQLK